MTTFQTEFPDFPAADFPALPEGFTDSSWGNDACPSMINEAIRLHIFVDYLDPAKRNFGGEQPRFQVAALDENGSFTGEDSLLDTDDWTEVLALIDSKRAVVS